MLYYDRDIKTSVAYFEKAIEVLETADNDFDGDADCSSNDDDGDGYGIGLGHFIHAMRRNIDLTYIVMNNQVYGLTTGQASPTSDKGMLTKSTPTGSLEVPVNPIAL